MNVLAMFLAMALYCNSNTRRTVRCSRGAQLTEMRKYNNDSVFLILNFLDETCGSRTQPAVETLCSIGEMNFPFHLVPKGVDIYLMYFLLSVFAG